MPAGVGYDALNYQGYAAINGSQEFGVGANVRIRTGTNARVAGMLLMAGATLAALKLLGFRFNVGVTS